jgi:hypothetical protein
MLARAGLPRKVDLWSLDVEGHELTVLGSVDFAQVPVGVLLVEDYSISTRLLDRPCLLLLQLRLCLGLRLCMRLLLGLHGRLRPVVWRGAEGHAGNLEVGA